MGKMTNFHRLRGKHFFNKRGKDEPLLQVFFRTLPSIPRLEYSTSIHVPNHFVSTDYLSIMNDVLGGKKSQPLNIKVSIVDQIIQARQIDKNTFIGKLNRRQVQMIECGKDLALVLPYLNKIVLQLIDTNWLRDYGVKVLQPCKGMYGEGAVRRAANVLLAFEYLEEGEPVVNEVALLFKK